MKYEKLEHSQVKATFEVTAEEFSAALDEAFTVCNAKVTIKGFRKGKAPKSKYLQEYGVQSLYDEALNAAVTAKMRDELFTATEFQVASQPMLDVDFASLEEGKGFEFTLTFDVYPEVVLGLYKGVEVYMPSDEVTEAEIKAEVERMLNEKKTTVAKEDRTIALGDTAKFDFVGSVDGVEFDGGKAEDYELKIGSGQFIPGFEDQMVGMVEGTEKDILVTFPENYGEASLAGKEANFHITLHEVTTEVYPELTDDLVKELKLTDVETVEAFNAYVENNLKTRKQAQNARQVENNVLETVVKNATIDMPQSFVAERAKNLRGQVEAQAKQYNIPFEMYLQFSGVTEEAFNAQCNEEALRQVSLELVLDKIAETENLLATDEQIDQMIADYAAQTNSTVEKVTKQIGRGPFAANIASNNAVKFVLDNKVEK